MHMLVAALKHQRSTPCWDTVYAYSALRLAGLGIDLVSHIHTYITYIHAYIHTCIHTCIRTYALRLAGLGIDLVSRSKRVIK